MIKRHLASLKITCTVVSIWRNRSSAHRSYHAWRQVGGWESWAPCTSLREGLPAEEGPKERPIQQNLQLLELWRYLPSGCLPSFALPERCWYLSLHLKRIAGFLPSCHWLICLSKLQAIFYHRDQWEALAETSVSYFGRSQGWEISPLQESVDFELISEWCRCHFQGLLSFFSSSPLHAFSPPLCLSPPFLSSF